jgi:hypothetical protein
VVNGVDAPGDAAPSSLVADASMGETVVCEGGVHAARATLNRMTRRVFIE